MISIGDVIKSKAVLEGAVEYFHEAKEEDGLEDMQDVCDALEVAVAVMGKIIEFADKMEDDCK